MLHYAGDVCRTTEGATYPCTALAPALHRPFTALAPPLRQPHSPFPRRRRRRRPHQVSYNPNPNPHQVSYNPNPSPRQVSYKAEGFVEKDRDQISPDLSALMHSSSAAICQAVFPKPKPGTRRSPLSRTTLSSQFKGQLTKLMETLRQTQPHFIRCIKPNSAKKKRDFDGPMAPQAEPQPDPDPDPDPDPQRQRQPRPMAP